MDRDRGGDESAAAAAAAAAAARRARSRQLDDAVARNAVGRAIIKINKSNNAPTWRNRAAPHIDPPTPPTINNFSNRKKKKKLGKKTNKKNSVNSVDWKRNEPSRSSFEANGAAPAPPGTKR